MDFGGRATKVSFTKVFRTCGSIKVLSPQKNISSSRKMGGRFRLGSAPANKSRSRRPELVGDLFGWVMIVSPIVRWIGGLDNRGHLHRYAHMKTRCANCGGVKWHNLRTLLKGLTNGCRTCSRPKASVPEWLIKRMAAAKSRCENLNDRNYKNYGGRGIRFKFRSVIIGALWVQKNIGLCRDLEIDRKNNEKHYAPGNLKWSTREQNTRNTRRTVMAERPVWRSPYSWPTTYRMLRAGLTKQDIFNAARLAVVEKRKNWRNIAERLASTIL